MRLDKYSPDAANEVREWIEEILGEKLRSGDLLEALKDGVALCRSGIPWTTTPIVLLTFALETGQPCSLPWSQV